MFFRRLGIFIAALAGATTLHAVDEFGDITVEPGAIYTGNTYHGYAEIRVVMENHSHTKTHTVTLTYPNRPFGSGNSISLLARTAKLEPEAQVVVSLLQPPLPAQGDGQIHVEIDGHGEGEVHAPNANNHCNAYSRSGGQMAVVFISRSLDYDAVERVFEANSGAFTAMKATGPPDATRMGIAPNPNCWMPDSRRHGVTNWLELDYASLQTANKISIYNTQSPTASGLITVIGVSGSNILQVAMSSGTSSRTPNGWAEEYDFPETSEAVKTVRLDFSRGTPPNNISIDAVEISGPSGGQWASDARASSDNSAIAPAFAPGGGSVYAVESLRAESSVPDWSDNWLGYSPFDAVVLAAADFSSMPPGVLAALGDYLYAGGNIVLVGKMALPDSWHPSQKISLPDGTEYEVGFGRCFALDPDNPSALARVTVQNLRVTVNEASSYWQGLPYDSSTANSVLPVVQNLKIPTRGIVIVMLAFIIIIGPVNIIYLNRRRRRTWLLWTIPAISLVTTLLVFAYSLLREGITPDTRIAGLTVLDQTSHQAATIGGTAFYCPLTPSGGLQFEFGTEATPLVEIGYYGSGNSREVDWTQSQHFRRGWVSARVPAHFHLRKSETRRERIQMVSENGKMQVVNGLSATVKGLWLADADGKIYQAYDIAAGQKGELTASSTSSLSEQSGVHGIIRDLGFGVGADTLPADCAKYLRPGTYLATLDGNPFIENALGSAASAQRTKASAVVFGILESPEDK